MRVHKITTGGIVVVAALCVCSSHAVRSQPSDSIFPAGTRIIYSSDRGGMMFRAVTLPLGQLTYERCEKIARKFIGATPQSPYAELVMGADDTDLRRSYYGTNSRPESEASFCQTLEQLGSPMSLPRTPIARVISMRGAALFTYREEGSSDGSRSGLRETVLVGGKDPTRFEVNGSRYRLLRLVVKRSTDTEFSGGLFYKSMSQPSCAACRELVGKFASGPKGGDWEAQIRRDVWFASEFFPVVFRFDPDNEPVVYTNLRGFVAPPSVAEYYRGDHLRCRMYYGEFSCDAYGRYEQTN